MKKIVGPILVLFFAFLSITGCNKKKAKVETTEIETNTATLESLEATGMKTTFYLEDEFSIGDLVVKAIYSDDSEETITAYEIDSSLFDSSKSGTYDIKITYQELSTSYTVTVKEEKTADLPWI